MKVFNKEGGSKREWALKMSQWTDKTVMIQIVDAETGGWVKDLLSITDKGIELCSSAKPSKEYIEYPGLFDDCGRIKVID